MGTRTFDQTVFIGDNDTTYTTTSNDYHSLTIWGDTLQIVGKRTPTSSSAEGHQGEICIDNSHIYVCISADTWVRAPLSTW